MEKMLMIFMIMLALGIKYWSCTGLPRYADPLVDKAFNASVKAANSRIPSPFLFRPYRSSLTVDSVSEDNSRNLVFDFFMQKTDC
ncbi:secreted phosphoprotein 24-like [Tupaia chinensis]|uniref:secreted phosphoprotein 24-like n=1 Tax=Tupaia chinensis TaxID=246437 RepID=UPI0003C8FAC1|nr:secreted phosphoprotein 24-like [Tupaia chinensis]